jgi:hypothetical protein
LSQNFGLKAVAEGPQRSLLAACAELGFGNLGVTALRDIAVNVGILREEVAGVDLFTVLNQLIRKLLPNCSDAELTRALGHRVQKMDFRGHLCGETLLEIDEAWKLMDQEDEKEVRKEQGELRTRKHAFEEYLEQYSSRVRELRTAGIAELASKKGKAKAKAKVMPARKPMPSTVLSQLEATQLLPPGASVWRIASNHGWAIHVPPMKRYSCPALKVGSEFNAMVHVLKIAWETYSLLSGVPVSECVVDGLFANAPIVKPGEEKSSSSSGPVAVVAAAFG